MWLSCDCHVTCYTTAAELQVSPGHHCNLGHGRPLRGGPADSGTCTQDDAILVSTLPSGGGLHWLFGEACALRGRLLHLEVGLCAWRWACALGGGLVRLEVGLCAWRWACALGGGLVRLEVGLCAWRWACALGGGLVRLEVGLCAWRWACALGGRLVRLGVGLCAWR